LFAQSLRTSNVRKPCNMGVNKNKYRELAESLPKTVTLVAVSKMRSVDEIMELYNLGHRDFGENYVQELVEKHFILPHDIRWHFIGHLQSNKVKYIAPFVHLIHGVDSFKLLMEIDRQAAKLKRVVDCLLQVHIASEETKFGLNEEELDELVAGLKKAKETSELTHVHIAGLMGMATFTDDQLKIETEFEYLHTLFDKYARCKLSNFNMQDLSMGMSADYKEAINHGATMIRVGSILFGPRLKEASDS
jgi:PLP dependent protein